MIIRNNRFITLLLAGVMIVTMIPSSAKANDGVAVTGYIEGGIPYYAAGVHAAIGETVVMNDGDDILASEEEANISENEAPVVTAPITEYSNIAIAQVNEYLNIRSQANAEAEVVGKLYNNNAAIVLEMVDGWYKITSGSVTGYVYAEYVVVGDEALCKSVSKRVGTVTAGALKFRNAPSLDSDVYTLLIAGKQVTVLDESIAGWYQITDGNYTGYASSEYITVETKYDHAESREEEAARLAAEAEARRKEEERWLAEQQALQAQKEAAANKTYQPPSGSNGQAVADYACQFIGNPYVWGGESLTQGADCSGFVKAIYAQFGFDLPHSSYGLRYVGYAVSVGEMIPGDIVCYSGHVGIYIGNGQIVHASNRRGGIKISNYTYQPVVAVRRIY